ncbi:MAG: GTP 3',8-cyclase MoaA [Pseudomonadales bacterium]|jgi:cyclic pyranopterin phosphate synthase|nr:GTP 3',8-cyclase MoaA [Gammaproteobacteria bacterium]MBP6052517.1 GTP 3',8-cyclase MoaA [Pseudomonadales bacterium]MBK6583076.1 GTP 3',8-cyclase MoaA [Gammaproteobacteria bacterium]MBK7168041.1 GTP 3',8-cyclase MoaA [Gammaproteobacteria bacterium]MBK7519205.1 GTP 3',8-cyclase MoaA [Gammaproteobacteria bacterium]
MNAATSPVAARLLVDRFGRQVNYVRLSVTDRCDFRCVYCMSEEMQFLPRSEILSLEELLQAARAFTALGVDKIRLTGGEPLVRQNILWLAERIAALPGLRELVLTTNGSQLVKLAGPLRKAGLKRINISLDSLDAVRFRELTRTGNLRVVLAGIDAACNAGFDAIKLNSVILRGRNDDEVLDLVEFARARAIDISFIEEMPLGQISEHDRAASFCSSSELQALIEQRHPLTPAPESTGGPSRYFRMCDSRSRIGFISPHSNNFCHLCNRVRLTVEGRLLLCLGNEHSVDLRALMRARPDDETALQEAIAQAIEHKPERHHFELDAAPQIVRFMNMTGG